MSKITELTPEQAARLPEFRDKWLNIGLSTEPVDRAKAELAIDELYESVGLEKPKLKIWMKSPPQTVEPGEYIITNNVEYDPFLQQARRVAD